MSFAKNICKNLRNNCSQILLDSANRSATDTIKTASKRAIHKIAETTSYFFGNKIANKTTKVPKTSQNNLKAVKSKEYIPNERFISPEIINE